MDISRTTLRLDPWPPEYDSAVQFADIESESAGTVNADVETHDWQPIVAESAGDYEEICFVDGVRRIEARVIADSHDKMIHGLFGSIGVGAVRVRATSASFTGIAVERFLILGSFFGTNLGGGANAGTVFRITPTGKLTTLYGFCVQPLCTDGLGPYAALVRATDGNLYGTTTFGGMLDVGRDCAIGCGTIYRITPSGTLTTLHRFNLNDGSLPYGRLIQATDGAFYGTTSAGGANYYGTVFKITEDGTFTVVHSFDGNDGATPYAGLMQATDGNFYGTTNGGGGSGICGFGGFGTIFKITPKGVLTTLYKFGIEIDCKDGAFPSSSLVEGTDGSLYGTTSEGGGLDCENGGCGTIFKITKTGTFTKLAQFDGSDGTLPYGGLVQATNGTFYGAAYQGGTYLSSATCNSPWCGFAPSGHLN